MLSLSKMLLSIPITIVCLLLPFALNATTAEAQAGSTECSCNLPVGKGRKICSYHAAEQRKQRDSSNLPPSTSRSDAAEKIRRIQGLTDNLDFSALRDLEKRFETDLENDRRLQLEREDREARLERMREAREEARELREREERNENREEQRLERERLRAEAREDAEARGRMAEAQRRLDHLRRHHQARIASATALMNWTSQKHASQANTLEKQYEAEIAKLESEMAEINSTLTERAARASGSHDPTATIDRDLLRLVFGPKITPGKPVRDQQINGRIDKVLIADGIEFHLDPRPLGTAFLPFMGTTYEWRLTITNRSSEVKIVNVRNVRIMGNGWNEGGGTLKAYGRLKPGEVLRPAFMYDDVAGELQSVEYWVNIRAK